MREIAKNVLMCFCPDDGGTRVCTSSVDLDGNGLGLGVSQIGRRAVVELVTVYRHLPISRNGQEIYVLCATRSIMGTEVYVCNWKMEKLPRTIVGRNWEITISDNGR